MCSGHEDQEKSFLVFIIHFVAIGLCENYLRTASIL